MDQTYRTSNNYKNRRHPYVQQCFVKLCAQISRQTASRSGAGAQGTWQPMIFTYFALNSSSKFCWHSSFNLAMVLHFCFWILVIIFTKITIQKEKNACHSIATCEHHKRKKQNWSKMEQNLKNNVNSWNNQGRCSKKSCS